MSVELVCDACGKRSAAVWQSKVVAQPPWIITGIPGGECIVACSGECFLPATLTAQRIIPVGEHAKAPAS